MHKKYRIFITFVLLFHDDVGILNYSESKNKQKLFCLEEFLIIFMRIHVVLPFSVPN